MADRFASQTKPSPEVPRLYGISNSSSVLSNLIVQLKGLRADWWSQLKHAQKPSTTDLCGLAAAIKTRI